MQKNETNLAKLMQGSNIRSTQYLSEAIWGSIRGPHPNNPLIILSHLITIKLSKINPYTKYWPIKMRIKVVVLLNIGKIGFIMNCILLPPDLHWDRQKIMNSMVRLQLLAESNILLYYLQTNNISIVWSKCNL